MSVVFRSITATIIALLVTISTASGAVRTTGSKTTTKRPAPKSVQKKPVAKSSVPQVQPGNPANAPSGTIQDISSQPLADEITHAVNRLKLFSAPNGKFNPNGGITGSELSAVITRATKNFPQAFQKPAQISASALTREKAVATVAQSLMEWSQRASILMEINAAKDPLRYFFEDNGFKDGKSVSKPLRESYAIAIYKGIIPDTSTLQPQAKCTRAYAAALVARAIPSANNITGLLLDCNGAFLPGAGGIRLKLESQVGDQKSFIFPLAGRFPSRVFSQAPGLVSINPNAEIVKQRRAGANPLTIISQRVEGNLNIESAPAIVISQEDADKVKELAKTSLLLQTWRVGVCDFTRIKPRSASAVVEHAENIN